MSAIYELILTSAYKSVKKKIKRAKIEPSFLTQEKIWKLSHKSGVRNI